MQEVVEVPGLVAQPQVERVAFDQVVEDHEVVDEHLVHPAYGLERVQVVLARLRLEVAALVGEQPRGRVHDLAALLEELRHRRLGQPLDLQVGPPLPHGVGDGEVAADVTEPDRRAEVQRPRPALRADAATTRRGGGAGDPVHEALDGPVDRYGMPGHRQVTRALEDEVLAAGPADDALAPPERLAAVVGALDHQHGLDDPAQQGLRLLGRAGMPATPVLRQHHVPAGGAVVGVDVLQLLGRVRFGKHVREEERRVVRPVVRDEVAVPTEPPAVVVELLVEVPCGLQPDGDRRREVASPRRHRDHALDPVGVQGRREQRLPGADADAGQHGSLDAEVVEDRERVGDHGQVVVRRRVQRASRTAVARRVDGDDAVVLREVRDLALPRAAVHARVDRREHDRARARVVEGLVPQPDALDVEVPLLVRFPSSHATTLPPPGCSAVATGLQALSRNVRSPASTRDASTGET